MEQEIVKKNFESYNLLAKLSVFLFSKNSMIFSKRLRHTCVYILLAKHYQNILPVISGGSFYVWLHSNEFVACKWKMLTFFRLLNSLICINDRAVWCIAPCVDTFPAFWKWNNIFVQNQKVCFAGISKFTYLMPEIHKMTTSEKSDHILLAHEHANSEKTVCFENQYFESVQIAYRWPVLGFPQRLLMIRG